MSIKGVDNQIMVARTVEFSKESTSQLKRGELAQNFATVQAQAESAENQTRVAKTQESEQAGLKLDTERESDGSSSGKGRGRGKDDSEDEDPGQMVPPGDNIIDIRI